MSKRLLTLALITFAVSACAGFPPMPDIEVKLIDERNSKAHIYQVPKQSGQRAPYLRSEPLTLQSLNKNYCIAPRQYSIFEEYMSKVEDHARDKCK